MAHRMAFPANRGVPLATRVSEVGDGWIAPWDLGTDRPAAPAPTEPISPNLRRSRIDVFAVDLAASDRSETKDLLYVTASFEDPAGRNVEVRSIGVALAEDCERFGGVCSNLYRLEGGRWSFHPLQAWARFEVRVDGLLTGSGIPGSVVVSDSLEDEAAPELSITLSPEPGEEGGLEPSFYSCERLGVEKGSATGWVLHWDDITFHQAPVLSVRAERGDTLARIAKEMSVDHELLSMANAHFRAAGRRLAAGDLVHVPLLIRAATPAAKKAYSAHALRWHEIINGWTTLN